MKGTGVTGMTGTTDLQPDERDGHTGVSPKGLDPDMKNTFEKDGYVVLRGAMTEAEVDRVADPICTAFRAGEYDGYKEDAAYPTPGIYSMGPAILAEHPEIAFVSLAHPNIVNAIETLFGEPATLAQYWSIMRPPGAGVDDKPFVPGSGAHFDYKPWRCVGSFVKWMFAVIPFVDYTEEVGPLCVSPGSYLKTKVLPSDGRVHQVDAAQVPRTEDVVLADPSLRKGDVVLMHGFSWHEARPNYSKTDRSGLYMKFYARSSPPACGPWIYPSAVHDILPPKSRHLVPHHRGDGKFAAVRGQPEGGLDEALLLIEDPAGRVLLLGDGQSAWFLPRYAAEEDESAGILDVGNVMGSVLQRAHAGLGLRLPWLSWLVDLPGDAPNGGEWRCRVYGHRLDEAAPALIGEDGGRIACRWMSVDEIIAEASADRLEEGADIGKWLHMWKAQEDEHGNGVTRSYGVPSTHVRHFRYNFRGNPPGHYRVGMFDDAGVPLPGPEVVAD